ncbi:MAG: flagellin lysine-N-methylase [Clostridia bacterium]|nr:flagellin lysine-N-methylase [Clostridia bacterium]
MDFYVPSYYEQFHCKADLCTDNCCIGWEIQIDPQSAARYRASDAVIGDKLRSSISEDDCFVLVNERCPMLDDKNLCEIIRHCGEEHLCQICRDHPRYFAWFGDRKEGGLGIACEEAARLVLTTDHVQTICKHCEDEPSESEDAVFFEQMLAERDKLFAILDDGDLSFARKLQELLTSALTLQTELDGEVPFGEIGVTADSQVDFFQYVELYAAFEPFDENWSQHLRTLQASSATLHSLTKEQEQFLVNLCRYFLWRYFLQGAVDGEVLPQVKFAVVSTLFIRTLCGNDSSLCAFVDNSKMYSKTMEYSDVNRDRFFDLSYDEPCLRVQTLLQMLRT